jgi:hypothetical protein
MPLCLFEQRIVGFGPIDLGERDLPQLGRLFRRHTSPLVRCGRPLCAITGGERAPGGQRQEHESGSEGQ